MAVVVNFCLRFFWLIWLWRDFDIYYGKINVSKELQLTFLWQLIAETLRRTIWSCLRVENEQLNNFENFREILVIPPVIDEQEESEIV